MILYRKANLFDILSMQNLVLPEVEKGIILPRTNDEIATNIRSYILACDDENIIGFGALHIHAPILAEVRSLIVHEKYQKKGIGKEIVNKLLNEAQILGVKQVFTLTFQRGFFECLSFLEIPKENLPVQKIWADCIKCKHFPTCEEIAFIKSV